MSEEQVSAETPEVSPSPESPTPTEAAPQSPAFNMDSSVHVDGEDVSVADLVNSFKRAGTLEEYKRNASILLQSPDAVEADTRENAMRYVMYEEGFNPSQIEDHIKTVRDYTEEAPMAQNNEQEGVGEQEQWQQYEAEKAQRMGEIEERQSKIAMEMMRKDLNSSLDGAMGNEQIKKLAGFMGEEGKEDRMSMFRKEVERQTMDQMKTRKNRGETFNSSWFEDESRKAAETVYDKFKSVIGDPNRIQRSPETGLETESLARKKPVPEPLFNKGDDMGTVTDKSHDWTTDTLSRLAIDSVTDGESRI